MSKLLERDERAKKIRKDLLDEYCNKDCENQKIMKDVVEIGSTYMYHVLNEYDSVEEIVKKMQDSIKWYFFLLTGLLSLLTAIFKII